MGLWVAQNGRRKVAEVLLDDSRPGGVVGRKVLEEGNCNRIQRADLPLEHLDDAVDRRRHNTALSHKAFEDLVELETDRSRSEDPPAHVHESEKRLVGDEATAMGEGVEQP
jgi:hypothetical protein